MTTPLHAILRAVLIAHLRKLATPPPATERRFAVNLFSAIGQCAACECPLRVAHECEEPDCGAWAE